MNRLTDANIVRSLTKWFGDNFAASAIDYGAGDTIDERTLSNWVLFSVDDIIDPAQTVLQRGSNRQCRVHMTAQCYGKDQANIHKALSNASTIRELFSHARVDVLDFDTSDNEVIGTISFDEAQHVPQSSLQGDANLDIRVISVDGTAGVC